MNPLTVAYNRHGKPRLVLDCRHINHLLCTYQFKYKDVSVVRQLFKTGDFTFVFDLKSAYHHIRYDLSETVMTGRSNVGFLTALIRFEETTLLIGFLQI